MPAIPTRLRLAVDALAHKPASRVLEIGCGTGLAAALVVKKLRTGRLVALDRSATAIAAARKRNPVAQAAGKIAFVTGELATAKLPTRRFDVIFAVHVNCFWTRDAARELTVVREALAPRGTFHLFYEAMTAAPARILACGETIAAALGRHGLPTSRARSSPRSRARCCASAHDAAQISSAARPPSRSAARSAAHTRAVPRQRHRRSNR